MDSAKKQEFAARVTQANKSELVVITYDIILSYMDDIVETHNNGDKENCYNSAVCAENFLHELMEALDYKYPISRELLSLYVYVNKQLVNVKIKEDISGIESAKDVMTKLRESFIKVSEEDKSAPLMSNTETIYAGITYGRGNLNEMSMQDAGNNRGFMA